MALPKQDLMEFEKAIGYMDPMQVTEYLQKILDFLNRNNTALCFPNISSYTEAFLVRLVTETKNLKSKSLNIDDDNKKLAAEIIDVLEMNRDVFRCTHAYECGKQNKKLLVYKKIFSNKLKMKPTECKIPTSSLSQRLAKAQNQTNTANISKIQMLNMTLRFIKNSSERILYYPEMPLTQAQYIYSLLKNPKSDLNVGFGYKTMCAPLFEALDVHGLDNVFEISFIETNKCDTTALKLEKKPRKGIKNSSKDESSLNSSTSSTKKPNNTPEKQPVSSIKNPFISRTLKRLLRFTEDPEMASVIFHQMDDEQLAFIKSLKRLAGNPESYGPLEQKFGDSLRQLNSNIMEVMKTCRLRVEEGMTKKKSKILTVKKVPKETAPSIPERGTPVSRSQSVPSKNSRDRSLSKERRIQFESGGKLDPNNQTTDNSIPSAPERKTETRTTDNKKERGRSTERLNARKTKLLEDMSVPLESDRGIRMMLLMGWNGGALGARGDGILEPIVPSIELPPGAGLGHVPPPKPEKGRAAPDFRGSLLQNILDLFRNNLDSKEVEFKAPLTDKERRFISTLLKNLNKRSMINFGVKAEAGMFREIAQAMVADVQTVITANVDEETKKITLAKSHNSCQKSIAKLISKLNKKSNVEEPVTMTVLNTNLEYEAITEESVNIIIENVIPKLNTTCKTPAAIKNRATRILMLQRFTKMVKSDAAEREFRIAFKPPRRIDPFLKNVVSCVNLRGRSSHAASEEMAYIEQLSASRAGWTLTLAVISPTQFVLSKKPIPDYHNRFYNSVWPADNNNDAKTNNQNQTKDDETIVISDDEEEEISTIVVEKEERKVKLEKVAKIETECDIGNKDGSVKDVGIDMKNKDAQTNNQNQTKDDETIVISDDEEEEILTIVVEKEERKVKLEKVAKNETECYIGNKDGSVKDVGIDMKNKVVGIDINNKDVEIDMKNRCVGIDIKNKDVGINIKNKDVGIAINNKDVGIDIKEKDVGINIKNKDLEIDIKEKDVGVDVKNKDVGVAINNKDVGIDMKNRGLGIDIKNKDVDIDIQKETETDDELSNSLCVCDTSVDICELDKDIQDLELAICEADLDFEVLKENSNISPIIKRSRSNSINSQETSTKRSKITSNCLIISTNDPERKINTEIIKTIQTRISEEFEKCTYFLPLLKCHGLQKEGLVYSCHDDNDVDWLESIINDLDLDLIVCNSGDDFSIEQKSRKMVIEVNSFIPLERKKLFSRLEAYNNGLQTALWKVLAEHTYESFVSFIVEIDENSFKYISKENFSLHAGYDKAQFSVIF